MARAVVVELQRQGYTTYEEVSVGYGARRADIVGVRGALVAVVETKRVMSMRFLDQLTRWIGLAHLVIGVFERGHIGVAVRRYCQHEGIGLWTFSYYESWIQEKIAPRLWRRAGVTELRRALRDDQRTGGQYADAGSDGGGYWTPFRGTCRALAEVVAAEPGIELRAAIGQLQHHYASARSALSSLPTLIRRGAVPGVRLVEGRPLRLEVGEGVTHDRP